MAEIRQALAQCFKELMQEKEFPENNCKGHH